MFKNHDKQFTETAVDPVLRLEAIADLSSRRNVAFWGAGILTLALIAFVFAGKPLSGMLALFLAMQWMFVFKLESDLRLLGVIDRLRSEEKPLAS